MEFGSSVGTTEENEALRVTVGNEDNQLNAENAAEVAAFEVFQREQQDLVLARQIERMQSSPPPTTSGGPLNVPQYS